MFSHTFSSGELQYSEKMAQKAAYENVKLYKCILAKNNFILGRALENV